MRAAGETRELNNHLYGVEWMSGEDEADAAEASCEEVLHRTDLLLFGHFSKTQTDLNETGPENEIKPQIHGEGRISDILPGRRRSCEVRLRAAVTPD